MLFVLFVFFLFGDIRIVEKHGDIEMLRKIFEYITAARCTAGMKQKRRRIIKRCDYPVRFKLIISHRFLPAFLRLSVAVHQASLP